MRHSIRSTSILVAVGLGSLAGTPAVDAQVLVPHLTPAGATVSTAVKAGTQLVFTGAVQGLKLNVDCTIFTAKGTIPATGLVLALPKPPVFGGCSDTLGGVDNVKISGKWSITANSTGSSLALNIPKAGVTFTSSAVAGCTLIVSPKGTTSLKGKYDNKSSWSFTNAAFPIAAIGGCQAASPGTATGVVVLSPGLVVAP